MTLFFLNIDQFLIELQHSFVHFFQNAQFVFYVVLFCWAFIAMIVFNKFGLRGSWIGFIYGLFAAGVYYGIDHGLIHQDEACLLLWAFCLISIFLMIWEIFSEGLVAFVIKFMVPGKILDIFVYILFFSGTMLIFKNTKVGFVDGFMQLFSLDNLFDQMKDFFPQCSLW